MRIGVDIVEIDRIIKLAEKESFITRLYTKSEIALFQSVSSKRKGEILAGRFAAKEATAKALGTGFSQGVTPRDLETLSDQEGRPVLRLHGKALQIAQENGLGDFLISLSHTDDIAIAYVVLATKAHVTL